MSDLKTSNVNIGLTKEELELAKANPEVFIEYLNYKRDILKSIDAERLAHEKEIELQRIEVEKSKIEHEKTYTVHFHSLHHYPYVKLQGELFQRREGRKPY